MHHKPQREKDQETDRLLKISIIQVVYELLFNFNVS